ncbi:MAG: (Fe-S)-binding protein [Planctomycetota bacterium]
MKVALYVSCLVDQVWPEVGEATVRLLRHAGCTVSFDESQTCCGQPACNSGYPDDALPLAKNVIAAFERSGAEAMVLPSGSCTAQIRHYPQLLANEPDWQRRALLLSMRTFELGWFLVHRCKIASLLSTFRGTVAWHDSCHALRDLGSKDEGRSLLRMLPGVELRELDNAEDCCGFGGTFAVKLPQLSVAIADRKLSGIARSGVDAVVGADVSCLLHVRTRLQHQGSKIRTLHLAEVLAEGLR